MSPVLSWVLEPDLDKYRQVDPHLFIALMHANASWHVLAEMLPIHPTVAEFYPTTLERLEPFE